MNLISGGSFPKSFEPLQEAEIATITRRPKAVVSFASS